MPDAIPCRLIRGPFDGDEGSGLDPLPTQLWVVRCHDPRCRYGGVHWYSNADRDDEDEGERYLRAGSAGGVQIYLWADPELESPPSAGAEEQLGAGELVGV